jgi:predicted amidophosphoribosyltransferase
VGACVTSPAPLRPAPAGLPNCDDCYYRTTGTAAICYACVSTDDHIAQGVMCQVCGGPVVDGEACANAVCNLPDRWFSRVYTISEHELELWTAICRYKYDEDRGWAEILGRVVAGYLEAHRGELARFDLITNGALYVGPRANRLWNHLRPILEVAKREAPRWPLVPEVIAKSGPSGQFLGRSPETRRKIAEHSLRPALSISAPDLVAERRVLVLDDVYSEGYSLREMAKVLTEAGATEVAGLVFARHKGG